MGKLAMPKYSDRTVKDKQIKFAGVNMRKGAKDGEIADMRNLCSRDYPILSVRPKRTLVGRLENPNGLFSWNGIAWADGTGFFYEGEKKGDVANSKKTFAGIGDTIVIMPDKKYYNTATDEFGSMEAKWDGETITFTNGTLYGEEAVRNAIQSSGTDWSLVFREGDAVEISGCTHHPENNKNAIIREIKGDTMHFYENVFVLDGAELDEPYTESGSMSIRRSVPELEWMCENENRLWGCSGNTIYASKLGDIFNFQCYDGINTDSYTVDTGSAGSFTGCVSYGGYPTFFKEENIYKVYGNLPSNFELASSARMGIKRGNGNSMAIAGETLFFLSRGGFALYTGGIPALIHDDFGVEMPTNASAGSDGRKYYCSAQMEDDSWRMLVYDTQTGTWHIEDETQATAFCYYAGELYFLTESGELWISESIGPHPGSEDEGSVEWWAEFSDFTEGEPNTKRAGRIQIRLELGEDASAQVWIQYDSNGVWEEAGKKMYSDRKRSYQVPVIPRRCDHYRLKISGIGECRIYSLTREIAVGSEQRTREEWN